MIKLGILEVGKNLPDLVPEHGTFAEWFITLLSQASRDIEFQIIKAYKGELPSSVENCQAYLITGSASSVYDDEPWLEGLGRFVMDAARSVPIVGICFGHQLIAHLGGAEVGNLREDGSKDLGSRETRVEGWTLLPGCHDLKVIASHREEVKTVPDDYRVVARRPGVPIDGLEHRRLPITTFQFHPEARDEFANRQGLTASTVDARLIRDSDLVLEAFRRRVTR